MWRERESIESRTEWSQSFRNPWLGLPNIAFVNFAAEARRPFDAEAIQNREMREFAQKLAKEAIEPVRKQGG
jgi:hypothetical protein